MANTLTNLIPDLYEGLDIVSRELTGFIPAVAKNSSAERAALNQTIRIPIAGGATVGNVTPAMALTEPTDHTITNATISITKSREANFGVIGSEQRGLNNNGAGWQNIQAGLFAQAVRALVNEVEADIAATYLATSRAFGTAGTAPFASNLSDMSNIHKILADNGAPMSEKQLVISTTAGVKMRNLTQLTNANQAGSDAMLRQGVLLDLNGFAIRESAQIKTHVNGTGASYTTDTAGYAVGDTVITLITGTGTVLAGDVVTFAGDTNKYIVKTGASAAGPITLAAPGLRVAIAGSATAMTIGADYEANCFFDRNAIQLITRAPEMPEGGDQAEDSTMIIDPRSGLAFEVLMYKGKRKQRFEVSLAWGVANIKAEHSGVLLG